mmetsp:Transcript_16025/g.35670  ORF Transcript_16025/g.35670 Transcript_16025/m.35670 type:complete len:1163 (-) Transcript_16025:124-3612(-)
MFSIECVQGYVHLPSNSLRLTDDTVDNGYVRRISGYGSVIELNNNLAEMTYITETDQNTHRSALDACKFEVRPTGEYTIADILVRTLLIDALPVNDCPEILVAGRSAVETLKKLTIEEDGELAIPVSIADKDIISGRHHEAHPAFFTIELAAEKGTIKLASTVGLDFLDGSDNSSSMRFRATIHRANIALSRITYRGRKDFYGEDKVDLYVSDEGNIGRGGPLSSTISIPIEVSPVDDTPIMLAPNYISCGEEQLCGVPDIAVKDVDCGFEALVQVEAEVKLGRIDIARSSFPSSISARKSGSRDQNLVVTGRIDSLNDVLGSLVYHGTVGTHSQIDTITLRFLSSAGVEDNNNSSADSMRTVTADINVLILDTANNGPRIVYDGAIYQDDEGCSAESPSFRRSNTAGWQAAHGGTCNMLVDTIPFTCTEDIECRFQGIRVQDYDSAWLEISLKVAHGSLVISRESSAAGIRFLDDTSATPSARSEQRRLVMRGSQHSINGALSNLIYLPDRDYQGVDNVVINLIDSGGKDSTAMTDQMTISVEVNGVDDIPWLLGPTEVLQCEEDGFVTVSGIEIVDNDADASQYTSVSINTKNGFIGIDTSMNLYDELQVLGVPSDQVVAATMHEWLRSLTVRGDLNKVNKLLGSMVFTPSENWNSQENGYGVVSVRIDGDGASSSWRDEAEYFVEVVSLNDRPSCVIDAKDYDRNDNATISVTVDADVVLQASVNDVDDDVLQVELTTANGSVTLFKRTTTCFACDDVDDVVVSSETHNEVKMQGTTASLNRKLSTIRFNPDPDYSEAKVSIVVRDSQGAADSAEIYINVIAAADAFQLWTTVDSRTRSVPTVLLDEGNGVMLGAEWRSPLSVLKKYAVSTLSSTDIAPMLVVEYREQSTRPRPFLVVDKENYVTSFCAELSVGIGSLSIDDYIYGRNRSSLEIEVGLENKSLHLKGTVDDVNFAAQYIIFAADTNGSGPAMINVTICDDKCGWDEHSATSRGCVETSIAVFIFPQNNPPTITVKELDTPPPKVVLNSKETPIVSIIIDDTDVQESYMVDTYLRSSEGVLTVSLSASKGTVSLQSLDDLTFTVGTGVSNPAIEFIGTIAKVNEALSKVYFSCMKSGGCGVGTAHLNITVNDNGFTGLRRGRRESLSSHKAIDIFVYDDE